MEAQPERSHAPLVDISLRFHDINPIRPVGSVLKRYNNIAILPPSGEFLSFISMLQRSANSDN
jgi:hypothetical protein